MYDGRIAAVTAAHDDGLEGLSALRLADDGCQVAYQTCAVASAHTLVTPFHSAIHFVWFAICGRARTLNAKESSSRAPCVPVHVISGALLVLIWLPNDGKGGKVPPVTASAVALVELWRNGLIT